jgi:surface polysaccharide O-acyltransferase-like enzyme
MQKEHLAWVDLLRIIACLLVVIAHSCDPFVGQFDNNRTEFLTGALVGSFVRPCVPLFVMISGVLLLPVKLDMTTFYARRAQRLIIPFVFWSMMLPVLYFLYVNSGVKIISPNIIVTDYRLVNTIQKLYTFVFNFNYATTALWYVYMLIGLYFFLPVISAWLSQASQRDIWWFLGFWIISMCLPYVQMMAPIFGYPGQKGLLGVCDWNAYGTFYYFSGFLGYLVLAYYLVRFPLNWSWGRTLSIAIPVFLIGYAVTSVGFILTQKHFPGNYTSLEIPWYYSGINVFLMTVSVFIIFQKVTIQSSPLLTKTSALTFGIYLSHFFFVQVGYDLIYPAVDLPAIVKIPMIALFAFSVSLLLVWLMSLNRLTRKVIA